MPGPSHAYKPAAYNPSRHPAREILGISSVDYSEIVEFGNGAVGSFS